MPIHGSNFRVLFVCAVAVICGFAAAQEENGASKADVRMRIELPSENARNHKTPAVLWLKPQTDDPPLPSPDRNHYTLLQKNRMFTPHLLVVPVGSVVSFPNEDPFFHNVFSLFNGKRFDLGLYEAGTTRQEVFPREGISYIFCNIHPEMSAVVVVVSTPYYAEADSEGMFRIRGVPAGEYQMHVWIEGLAKQALDRFTRRVQITAGTEDLGVLDASSSPRQPASHLNKFGQPYDRDSKPAY
jgi:hypothetical protein